MKNTVGRTGLPTPANKIFIGSASHTRIADVEEWRQMGVNFGDILHISTFSEHRSYGEFVPYLPGSVMKVRSSPNRLQQ